MRQGWAKAMTIPGLLAGLAVLWVAWPAGPRLRVAEVTGEATLERSGVEDPVAARVGTRLQATDHVTTAAGSQAVLTFGQESQIRVGPESSVQVASVDDQGLFLEIEDGSIRAIVRPDSGEVRIGNQGREVRASDATVDVGVRESVLQVRALEGQVDLKGMDRETLVAGEAATVVGRRAKVGRVPTSLLLSVRPPDEARTARRTHTVHGTTAPAAKVVLQGPVDTKHVVADAQGNFSAPLGLAEGDNQVTVEATDLFGQRTKVTGALPVRDTTGPIVRGDVEYPK